MQQKNKFCFLVYTNEKYQPIADLTLGEFDKYFPENPFRRYIVSNKFSSYDFKNKNSIFIDCDVEFDGSGYHFAQTMIKALNQIDEEYILFFCDDYMFIDKPNLQRLGELTDFIQKENIDFFSFASMYPRPDWEKFNFAMETDPECIFYNIAENCHHLYSVQPCIWKKSALLDVLKHNPSMSLHDLDTTNIKNREGCIRIMNHEISKWDPYLSGSQSYGFKNICTNYLGYDEYQNGFKYFIFPYIEIIRWGFFNMHHETNTKRFLQKFIQEKNIQNDENLKKFIHP